MKPGDLLYIKSSEEPVVVIGTTSLNTTVLEVSVRRPVFSQSGTSYVMSDFYRFELETPEEQDLRKLEDIKRRHLLSLRASKEVDNPQLDMFAPADPKALRN